MKLVLVTLALAGCYETPCTSDSQCSDGDVCARTEECAPPSELIHMRVSWTLAGQPASTASCAGHDQLRIGLITGSGRYEQEVGFSPVPCVAGVFPIDRLPDWYDRVELGFDVAGDFRNSQILELRSDGTASFDLLP